MDRTSFCPDFRTRNKIFETQGLTRVRSSVLLTVLLSQEGYMADRCPVCGQALPEKISVEELQSKIESLTEKNVRSALALERKKLEEKFEVTLLAERETARQKAERMVGTEIKELKEQVKSANSKSEEELAKAKAYYEDELKAERERIKKSIEKQLRDEIETRMRKATADAVSRATQQNEQRIDKIQGELEKQRLRHEGERARLITQVDNLSRKLESASGQELGEQGEIDLFLALRQAFPRDQIQRISKGVKGGDILHEVVEGTEIVGKIVYESKNVATWQQGFVQQAKKYQTQYETPNTVIVSRVFPKKEKDFCICGGIPVVSPRMAITLATIIRGAVIEIARLRSAGVEPDQTAQTLFEYVLSDRFATRFREIADTVDALKAEHRKERDWHEKNWERRSSLHDRMETRQREINAQLESILRDVTSKKPIQIAARATK
jgi:hypothetical protein